MKYGVYKVWFLIGLIVISGGMLIYRSNPDDLVAFLTGASIVGINALLLGKGITSIISSRKKFVYILLLVLKYAFLLTTLYITIVIIKLNPIPFILGITTLPVSIVLMTIFLLRRHDNA
jgi:hypothetical protein